MICSLEMDFHVSYSLQVAGCFRKEIQKYTSTPDPFLATCERPCHVDVGVLKKRQYRNRLVSAKMLNIDMGNMLKTNGSHLGKGKIIFKSALFFLDMLVPWRVNLSCKPFDEDLVKGWSQAEKLFT